MQTVYPVSTCADPPLDNSQVFCHAHLQKKIPEPQPALAACIRLLILEWVCPLYGPCLGCRPAKPGKLVHKKPQGSETMGELEEKVDKNPSKTLFSRLAHATQPA